MFAELIASENEKIRLYDFEKFDDGSGYKALVDIVSGHFSCNGKEFYFEDLEKFFNNINKGYEKLKGEASLKFRYEEDQINFKFTSLGHVIVSGVFREYSEHSQCFEFSFETNQSYLPEFIKQVGAINNKLHS